MSKLLETSTFVFVKSNALQDGNLSCFLRSSDNWVTVQPGCRFQAVDIRCKWFIFCYLQNTRLQIAHKCFGISPAFGISPRAQHCTVELLASGRSGSFLFLEYDTGETCIAYLDGPFSHIALVVPIWHNWMTFCALQLVVQSLHTRPYTPCQTFQ